MKMPNLAPVYQAGEGRSSIDPQVGSKRFWAKAWRAAKASGAAAAVRRRSRRRMGSEVWYQTERMGRRGGGLRHRKRATMPPRAQECHPIKDRKSSIHPVDCFNSACETRR